MAEHYSSFDRRGWRWLLQRLTAAFLIVVLAFHFMLLHFVNHADQITFMGSQARMSQVGYFATMLLFLVTATFHGVNGVYNALLNQGLDGTAKRVVLALLVVASAALLLQGTRLALALTGMDVSL
jgi:succinate dehydrogenase / fumarate reductase membrane anchor subunit